MNQDNIYKVHDFKMITDPVDVGVSLALRARGLYEYDDIELSRREILIGSNVIDVGAHIGLYTIFLSKHIGDNGKVFSFEPSSHNFSILEENIKLNNCNNVISNKLAVFDKELEVDLYINDFNTGDNRIYYPGVNRKIEKVKSVKLDDVINIPISYIKIDTQGVELPVLKGSENLLKKYHPKILFEYWPRGMHEFGYKEEDLLNYLKDFGYKIYRNGNEFNYNVNEKIDYINLFAKQ